MNQTDTWYKINNIEEFDTPALVVYPDRIKENIHQMVTAVGNPDRLRPHVKTYKMQEVVKMQLEQGINKFKCATISEGEMLGMVGASEVLLAYQPVGPKISRLLSLVKHFPNTRFSTLVDNIDSAKDIANVFSMAGSSIEVFLDIDVGMHRTGIAPDENALELYAFCSESEGIDPLGLHVYDGHLRDQDYEMRKEKCDLAFSHAENLQKRIMKQFGSEPLIIAGGSPTFSIHSKRDTIQCSPGTCLLWDWGYNELLPEQNFKFGALVVCRIISKIENHLICADLGHKSIAAENPFPRVQFLNLPDAKPVSQSEEHLVLDVGNNQHYQVGEVLYGVPIHICPTCALYERAHVVEGNAITKSWRVIARDRMITL
ncbi:D-TA family PLP-dependent enzyme [Fulvivirgaceae bacterium BMA10]|uniref:D-TA family PLP-dependent enzyme n=1 Tax=Splendidivirga corallicola TaxID=3051826 RepID=A0ABT8KXC9_9BACT|nr:D-TA family PLP-dependent enzyme [Fulvivirgaceae bacterium BMA10]